MATNTIKRSKRYLEAIKKVDKNKIYELEEAIELLKSLPKTKFDQTVELTINLKINPKKSDQQVRGTCILPHGTGKSKKIAVICPPSYEEEAKRGGADYVGLENLIEKIKGGWLDFDVLIAVPEVMPKLAPLGKILGPRGLMPNPKNDTVTTKIYETITEFKKGKLQIKNDRYGIIHVPVGKISMETKQLSENVVEVLKQVASMKPEAYKGKFIESAYLSLTMSPSVQINVKNIVGKDI